MADFTISYEALSNAANTLNMAVGEYQRKIARLQMIVEDAHAQGVTGNAIKAQVAELQARLRTMIAISNELRGDLQATLQDMQGDVDPGMAARFDN